ncbi:hypothetical protein F4801DRAFT_564685 [Xylaria longipes]|nr:hypothetical protein F4801DRAFT_564685 [Xylaria longipes]
MSLGPAPKYIISQLAFTDRDSFPALSVYRGILPTSQSASSTVLPPLFSIPVYVTYEVTPASAREDLARKFLEHVLVDFHHSDLLRLDVYFEKDASTAAIIHHDATERDTRHSFASNSMHFRRLAVVIPSNRWETEGVDLLFHDPPAELLKLSDRKEILGDDITEEGTLLLHVTVLEGHNRLSVRLRQIAENARDWVDFDERYRTAIEQGKTQW